MTQELNDYELQRQERIRQNRERMEQLNLQTLAAEIIPAKPIPAPKPKGLAKRKRPTEEAPRRRSSRIQGIEADGLAVDKELRDGTVSLLGGFSAAPAVPKSRYPKEEIPFKSLNASRTTDEAFLQTLRNCGTPIKSEQPSHARRRGKTTVKVESAGADLKQICSMSLTEDDWSKVTKDAVTHLHFMPTSSALILAAADKRGNIGLWNVDYTPSDSDTTETMDIKEEEAAVKTQIVKKLKKSESNAASPAAGAVQLDSPVEDAGEASEDDDEDFDGVLSFTTHHEYVSGLKWASDGSSLPSLFTCAYDGSLRKLDVERGVFDLAWGDEDMEYSCFDVTSDGKTAFIGDKDGDFDIIDLREKKRTQKTANLHNRKVNTLQLDPSGGHIMVTSSTDATVRLWDVRKLGGAKPKAVATAIHSKGCQGAFLAPDGSQRVVSTSFDDTVRIWDGKKDLKQLVSIKHDNNTGRWILPFRAIWGANSDAVMIGNMKRNIDVYNAETGKLASQLSSDYMTAIPPRLCVHPMLPVLAGGSGSGRMYVYRV